VVCLTVRKLCSKFPFQGIHTYRSLVTGIPAMHIQMTKDASTLVGKVRTTLCSPKKNDHFARRVPTDVNMQQGQFCHSDTTSSIRNQSRTAVRPGPSRKQGFSGPSGSEKWSGQGARAQTVRMYGKPKQRSHGHFLRPAIQARTSSAAEPVLPFRHGLMHEAP